MKTLATCLLLAFAASLALAHEFWLQPATFFAKKNQPVRVQLRVGENFTGEPWEAGTSRVTRFQSFLGKKKTDWLPQLNSRGLDSLVLSFPKEGTHLVALATNSKFIELEAEKFNDYLIEDGLQHVLEWRKKNGQAGKPGRELYRREAAALVQVGEQASDVIFKKSGFDLQILPAVNPCRLRSGETLRCQIRFKSKPLAGAKVHLWMKSPGSETTSVIQISDEKGWVSFRPASGDNMISVVQMIPHSDLKMADWQSIWGNLTFGVK